MLRRKIRIQTRVKNTGSTTRKTQTHPTGKDRRPAAAGASSPLTETTTRTTPKTLLTRTKTRTRTRRKIATKKRQDDDTAPDGQTKRTKTSPKTRRSPANHRRMLAEPAAASTTSSSAVAQVKPAKALLAKAFRINGTRQSKRMATTYLNLSSTTGSRILKIITA